MRKIVLSGGGTAGHVTPIIALLPFLSDCELHFIGTDGIESRLMKDYPQVKYHTIHCVKYVRNKIFANASVPIELIRSVSSARRILKEINPDTVFCKGGYVSLPVGLATAKPTRLITHESDISMGLTNRLIAGRCEKVCLSFDTIKHKNAVYTGAIIRQSIYKGNRIYPSPTLLVMGGSLGAGAINEATLKALPVLTKRYFVIHIAGKGKTDGMPKNLPNYRCLEYSSDMPSLYASADYVVTRGGANSLCEIVALGLKAVVIPLPKGASRGDQEENAEYFRSLGCVKVLPQQYLSACSLIDAVNSLKDFSPKKIDVDGTAKVAKLILND